MFVTFMTWGSVIVFALLCIRALYLAWQFRDIVFLNRPVENEDSSNWARDRAGIDVGRSLKLNGWIGTCVFVFGCAFSVVNQQIAGGYGGLMSFGAIFVAWFIGAILVENIPATRRRNRAGQMC